SQPTSAAVGDVNGDGHLDIVAATLSGPVTVALGDGSGGFGTPTRYVAGAGAWLVELGDVNGDGATDIVVANQPRRISVLLGDGHGGFSDAIGFDSLIPKPFAVGDVNGDGRPDVVVGESALGAIAILSNLGTGSPFFALCSADFADPHACPCGNTGLTGRGC